MAKTIKTREEWLNVVLHKHVASRLRIKAGVDLPADCKVSVGFPGGGSARKRIGECWPRVRSSLKVNEIFLNPSMTDVRVLVATLVHEAIHAADDCQSGHKGFFRKTALAVGLEGKMTSTHAGAQLADWIESVLDAMPAFEYGSLNLDGRKKQGIRMVKHQCPEAECQAIWRAAAKWTMVCCPCCGTALEGGE